MACLIEGCEQGGRLRRGWCQRHYFRWYRRGDPLDGGNAHPITPLATRWESKVVRGDGCWLWTGSRSGSGYGELRGNEGKLVRAHRASWEIHVGPIPKGLLVLHHCDNPPCVNPGHLFLGTHKTNAEDRQAKGRQNRRPGDLTRHHPRGDEHRGSKLTSAQVLAIRDRVVAGERRRTLASEYSVSEDNIGLIVRRITWAHLP